MTGFTDGTFRKQLDQINCIISIFITCVILSVPLTHRDAWTRMNYIPREARLSTMSASDTGKNYTYIYVYLPLSTLILLINIDTVSLYNTYRL